MIILDTNVVSEELKPKPSAAVSRWVSGQDPSAVFITTITVAEILYGIERLSAGGRRERFVDSVVRLLSERFSGRILAFDEPAASAFAQIVAGRERLGRPIAYLDAMIASIARSHASAIATRNTRDFEHCGIRVLDPWTEAG